MKTALTASEARRLALGAQGFAPSRRAGAPGIARIAGAVDTMHLLQIDSVNVLARSHYLPVFARIGAYPQDCLDEAAFGLKKRRMFEYWAHEASFLPLNLYPLMRWRMARAARGEGVYKSLSAWAAANRPYVARVLAEVRDKGALGVSALDEPGDRSGAWWGWSPGKYALEHLFNTGDLAAATRRGFERLYDVAERVIPPQLHSAAAPAEAEAIRSLLDMAGAALGVATEIDLREYFRLPVPETQPALRELVEAGRLIPATVEGWKKPAFLHAEARLPRRVDAHALLSPFDPVIWERPRAERLFDFRYRIEIYTPAEKRIYGYYVLPFLMGERIAARVCLKSDRAEGVLRVNAAHREEAAEPGETAAALASELMRMAGWLGLGAVAVARRGNLHQALARALRA